MASAPTPGSTPGSSTEPTTGLSPAARRGYGLGSVATGSFGTVPGLLLLPYLTDRLGVAAGVAGLVVFLPKAWDVILNPIAGRISDRSTNPGGRRRPFLIRSGTAARPRLRAALRRADLPDGPGDRPGSSCLFLACATAYAFFQVPYVAMPAEMTDDYDERTRLMTWRVAILALDDPGQRRSLAGHPQRARPRVGLPRRGPVRRRPDPDRHGRRVVGHPQHPRCRDAATAGGSLRRPAEGRRRHRAQFRTLLTVFVLQALATGAMLAGVDYVARVLLGVVRLPRRILFVCFVAPALLVTPLWQRVGEARDKRTGYIWGSLLLAGGALATVLTVRLGVAATALSVAVVGVGYAACQMFPLAMLPDVAAADTARTGESRARHLHRSVDGRGDARPRPRPAPVCRGARRSAATSRRPIPLPSSRTRRTPRSRSGFTIVPAVLVAVSLLVLRRLPARRGGAPMTPIRRPTSRPTTDEVARHPARRSRPHDLPTHGGRTLAYVYDSGLADADAVGLEALAMFASSNGLDPTAFPSLLRMENDLVALAGRLARRTGRLRRVGHLRVARSRSCSRCSPPVRRADVNRPEHGAADLGARRVPQGRRLPRGRAPSSSTSTPSPCAPTPPRWQPPSTTRTVLVVASAPSYAHGVVDPVDRDRRRWQPSAASAATSTPASAGGCCRTSTTRPPWTFAVEGVTSISVDLHKYAYTPKGVSVLLHRTPALRRGHFFASANWPGYTMLNSTMQSTRSGGPLAAAWAVTHRIGVEGYARPGPRGARGDPRGRRRGRRHPGPARAGAPDSTLRRPGRRRLLRRLHHRRRDARARLVRAAAAVASATCRRPCTSPCRPPPPRRYPSSSWRLRESVGRRPRRRPGQPSTRASPALVAAIDPATLDEARASPGCSPPPASPAATAPSPCPRRMAPVNALLDACPPPLREALLLGVLDRLSRPTAGLSAADPRLPLAPPGVLGGADPAPQPEGRRWPPRRSRPRPVAHRRKGHAVRSSSRPSATTSTRRWRECPTATRSSTARAASG